MDVWRAVIVLATACGSRPVTNTPPEATRLWIGGDVFLGAGGHHALSSIPAIVGGAPGIVNLEGPVGASATGDLDPSHPRLIHDASALAELRAAGVIVAGIANNHAHDAGPDGDTATVRALAAVDIHAAGG
ncbi:MAG TPA: CapA family protein, partial [Kofleriaceae bacterium]|nr:CapA family protein [Kofleriaceae bacterium]